MENIRLPWYRVHIVILNDPGRIISVHLMHTSLVSGWSSVMSLFELTILDPTDPVFNPLWRQGMYSLPFASRLGVTSSVYDWYIGSTAGLDVSQDLYWTYEIVALAHLLLSGLLALSSFWHWAYWDLELFIETRTGNIGLDLIRVFGIHLILASGLGFFFGLSHLSGFSGPGFWTSDSAAILGSVRAVKPVYSIVGLTPYCYGVVASNQIITGFLGFLVGIWHVSTRPGPSIYALCALGNIESVLATSLASILFTTLITSSTMWFGSITNPVELLGPSRYQWDNGYFAIEVERRVKTDKSVLEQIKWEEIPDKLIMYDYIGTNPSKGGLFRSGPMVKGDGLIQNWLGHPIFELGTTLVTVRRMPSFFETFPVVLVDQGGTVRADIPFRRAESRYSVEQVGLIVYFVGGVLTGSEFSSPSLVKAYARKSQFGEIFSFDKKSVSSDGVFRTSSRGWYSFGHSSFSILFLLGHLWHSARALFKAIWTGLSVDSETLSSIEYGRNEKLGDSKSKSETSSTFI
jgi:photosystem II CP47 chlorophyll apoprotein